PSRDFRKFIKNATEIWPNIAGPHLPSPCVVLITAGLPRRAGEGKVRRGSPPCRVPAASCGVLRRPAPSCAVLRRPAASCGVPVVFGVCAPRRRLRPARRDLYGSYTSFQARLTGA
ncbi:hypothetical protein AB4212_53770, partial [Streptomyces sp. 2MCAF27]